MSAAIFDNYAHNYDEHFTFSAIGLLQRQMVYQYLLPLLNKQNFVLELNCGTGYDAFEISKHVNTVLATDASHEMIKECKAKIDTTSNVNFDIKLIQEIEKELGSANFVFSNFGGLNCVSPQDLKIFISKCNALLCKDADLFFVIMGQKCIWEKLYFLIKGDTKKAFRRKQKNGVNTIINGSEFKTWYYSPKEIQKLFDHKFKVEKIAPVGLFVPPSYLNSFFSKKKPVLNMFNTFDKLFCKFKWTANYADHYIIHFKKTS